MSKQRTDADRATLRHLARNPARGEVFWWLYDNYPTLREYAETRRLSWQTLLADLQKLGLCTGHGAVIANTETLRSTYNRVRDLRQRETSVTRQHQRTRPRPAPRNAPPPEPPQPVSASPPPPSSDLTTASNQIDALVAQFSRRSNHHGG